MRGYRRKIDIRTGVVSVEPCPDLTAEEQAAIAADQDARVKLQTQKDNVEGVLSDLKAATLTFGSTARDNAMKKVLKAEKYLIKGVLENGE